MPQDTQYNKLDTFIFFKKNFLGDTQATGHPAGGCLDRYRMKLL